MTHVTGESEVSRHIVSSARVYTSIPTLRFKVGSASRVVVDACT
jgi:hypothetical protein